MEIMVFINFMKKLMSELLLNRKYKRYIRKEIEYILDYFYLNDEKAFGHDAIKLSIEKNYEHLVNDELFQKNFRENYDKVINAYI